MTPVATPSRTTAQEPKAPVSVDPDRSNQPDRRAPTDPGPPQGTRERILDIALDLFIDNGFDKTSLRQIAEQLGFSKAALYYHFASKDDILMALHLRVHEVFHEALA